MKRDGTEQEEVQCLAIEIADAAARCDIECLCMPTGRRTNQRMPIYDTTRPGIHAVMDGEDSETVTTALRYCELRGLVDRLDPDRPHLVSFKASSKAMPA